MKVLKGIFLITVILMSINSFAQITISGNIKDEITHENIPNISVYLPELKKGTLTDENGHYQITDLKKGFYLIEGVGIGYQSQTKYIELKSDTIINFSLNTSVTELNEVVITGVTRLTELKKNPVIIKTADKNILNQNNSTNLIDALKTIPGISEITSGPNISKPVIRGLGYNRVITLNNGMKQEGQQWGDEHGIEIDEYAIDRVEIIKGPGSLMYGSDGIAGILNFLPPKSLIDNHIKTQVLTNYQSNNNLIGYSLSNSGNKSDFQWYGAFSNKYAGNYKNKYDGKVYNSGFNEFNGKLSVGIVKKWGRSHLYVNSYNTQLGIIEGARDDNGNFIYENDEGNEITASKRDLKGYQVGIPFQRVNHFSIATNNYIILNKGSLNIDLGFQNNRRREYEDEPDLEALYLSLNTFNYNLSYYLKKIRGWDITVGIGGMQQNNKNKGIEYLIPDYHLFDNGIFTIIQKDINKLSFSGGLRFDNRNIYVNELLLDANEISDSISNTNSILKFPHFKKNYLGISGSLGFSYLASKTSVLKFNLSQGFRVPNIAELASNGKHEGTFRYEVGNSNLKSEISRQIDLAYSLNTEHLSLEISPFVNFISHYIFLERMSDEHTENTSLNPDNSIPTFQYTSGNAILIGGEIYIDWHPHPLDWLHIENSFSYVQAKQKNQVDSSKYLPFIPAPHYRGGLKAEFSDLNKNISNIYVKFNIDYYFTQNKIYRAFETETSTPGYALLSAGIGIRLNAFERKNFINFYLSGSNLSNIAYQNHLSRLKYTDINPATDRKGVFDMGRNISLKMVLNL